MNLCLSSSSFDKIINPYSEFLGLHGGGADDLVEHRGGGGIPLVNLMEELLGSLIPPRRSMSAQFLLLQANEQINHVSQSKASLNSKSPIRSLDTQPTKCNTRFIKEHKPSNHIRARIKSHVYTTE